MSWRPELSWTCPPRVVFDVLDWRDSNPQQRRHSKYQGRRMKDGHQPVRGRTRQRVPAGQARRSQTIRPANPNCWQTPTAGKPQLRANPNCGQTPTAGSRIAPINYSLPVQGGGDSLSEPAPPLLDGFGARSARCRSDWPKGAPSPLIGPGGGGGVAGITADCPSNRKRSNIVLRSLSLAERQQTRPHLSDGSRETPSPSFNSAHRERYGIRMERGEGVVVKAKIEKKTLTIKITPQRTNI